MTPVTGLVSAAMLAGILAPTALYVRRLQRDLRAARLELEARGRALQAEASARRKATASLEHARERAGAATRAKSTFLANMSHELRTPLNAIIGYSELLQEELEGDPREDVRRIVRAANKLLAFVSDVLDLSRMEVGEVDLVVEHVELPALITEVVERNRAHVESSGNSLEVQSLASLGPAPFRTDAHHLSEALEVLLDNAGHYTCGGLVRVEVEEILRQGRRWCRISVRDTGDGIEEALLDDLFEPFTERRTSVSPSSGAGLGLPRAQRYAQMLGGNLYVRSKPGDGSTFIVELPELDAERRNLRVTLPPDIEVDSLVTATAAPDASTEAVVSAIALQSGAPRGPVLLVEDDLESRQLLASALRRAGLVVHEAHNGVQALEALDRMRFAVVLLDLMMPEMDGFAVIEAIHRDPRLQGLPVMVCTAMDLDVSTRERLRGTAGVLRKHDLHDPVHIVSRVRSQLES